jgi:hypothetical protein
LARYAPSGGTVIASAAINAKMKMRFEADI